MSCYKPTQGQRVFALGFLATMRQHSALGLLLLNIKQAIDELRNRKETS